MDNSFDTPGSVDILSFVLSSKRDLPIDKFTSFR